MKQLIFVLALIPTLMMGQVDESKIQALEQDITELYKLKKETDKKFETVQLNLQKCHKEYKGGVIFQVVGLAAILAAIPFYNDSPGLATGLNVAGGACVIIGTIKIWNSHKYINRAVEY